MRLGLETFSYHLAYSTGRMDVFRFIRRAHELGLDGVQINVVQHDWGHLGGASPAHLHEVRALLEDLGLYVELDTRGTAPERLAEALKVAHALGADVLRTYASLGGELAAELRQAVVDLRAIAPLGEELGVKIAFENHEYEISEEVVRVVREVDDPQVGVLVDTGNAMMVWEDPVAAVAAMAPYAVSSHFKDHVMVLDDGVPNVVGVPLGTGNIDGAECYRILLERSPLERINIESCYAYRAPFRRRPEDGCGARLGEGAFRILEPPYDPGVIAPRHAGETSVEREQLLAWENRSVERSVAYMKSLRERFGG